MAEVVVRPHDGDVLGEREACIIERKHPFIGDKDLQGLIGPFVMQDGSDDLALIGDDFFEKAHAGFELLLFGKARILVDRTGTEAGIVDSAHPERKTHLIGSVLFDALLPIFLQFGAVLFEGIVVQKARISLLFHPRIKFVLIAPKQHIAVRCADDDAHLIGKPPVFGIGIEGIDVHRRPDVVALEAQDELKDRAVGRRADGSVCCMQLCPGIELLLIVEEDPAVLHAWPIHVLIVGRKRDLLPLTDGDIGKLIPGRDAELPREIVDAVDRSSSAIPQDEQTSVGEQFLKIASPARLSVFIFQKG